MRYLRGHQYRGVWRWCELLTGEMRSYEICRCLIAVKPKLRATVQAEGSELRSYYSWTKDPSMRLLLYRYGTRMDAAACVWDDNIDAIAVMAELDPQACGDAFPAGVTRKDWDMLHLLLRKGVRGPPVVTVCRTYLWRQPAMTRVLLEHGMDPSLPNWLGVTPLHDLCNAGGKTDKDENRHELLDLFLEFGADINANCLMVLNLERWRPI